MIELPSPFSGWISQQLKADFPAYRIERFSYRQGCRLFNETEKNPAIGSGNIREGRASMRAPQALSTVEGESVGRAAGYIAAAYDEVGSFVGDFRNHAGNESTTG